MDRKKNELSLPDYEPLSRPGAKRNHSSSDSEPWSLDGSDPNVRPDDFPGTTFASTHSLPQGPGRPVSKQTIAADLNPQIEVQDKRVKAKLAGSVLDEKWVLRRGHILSFVGLLLFTFILYFRPYEWTFAPAWLQSSAYWVAIFTLVIFVPTQLGIEGNITAPLKEVYLVGAFTVLALLSIAFAINPLDGWNLFSGTFIKVILMFVVMVNVVRTELRLKIFLWLAFAVGLYLSVNALEDYRLGNLTVEGYRIEGHIGGLFDNPNDLALFLATMIPIAIALIFSERGLKKLIYLGCAACMMAAIVVTYSRSGFLGFFAAMAVLVWKLGRRNRFIVTTSAVVVGVLFLILAPGNYGLRILSIFGLAPDTSGSASTRHDLLVRSLWVALRHPLLGIGMGNFPIVSIHDKVSHNSYTQVASEMGMIALVIYIMLMVVPFRRLRQIERETFETGTNPRFFYLAVGLQASLVAYMVSSFFASVAYLWNVYYLVCYAVCLRRVYAVRSKPKAQEREAVVDYPR